MKMLLVHGWFWQEGTKIDLNPNRQMARLYRADGHAIFHGCFVFPQETELFNGHIDDHCGHADIVGGLFDGTKLEFLKQYVHRDDPIEYKFVRDGVSNIFNGSYEGILVGRGSARLMLIEPPDKFFS